MSPHLMGYIDVGIPPFDQFESDLVVAAELGHCLLHVEVQWFLFLDLVGIGGHLSVLIDLSLGTRLHRLSIGRVDRCVYKRVHLVSEAIRVDTGNDEVLLGGALPTLAEAILLGVVLETLLAERRCVWGTYLWKEYLVLLFKVEVLSSVAYLCYVIVIQLSFAVCTVSRRDLGVVVWRQQVVSFEIQVDTLGCHFLKMTSLLI